MEVFPVDVPWSISNKGPRFGGAPLLFSDVGLVRGIPGYSNPSVRAIRNRSTALMLIRVLSGMPRLALS